jgi:uncharacterized protein (DUF2237 family)
VTFKIARLNPTTPVTDKIASPAFQRAWASAADHLEATGAAVSTLTDDVDALKEGAALVSNDNEFTGNNIFDRAVDTRQGYYVNGIQVVGPRDTGWTAGTGTESKGAFAAYDGQTISDIAWASPGYSLIVVRAIDAAAKAASERLLAVENALRRHGLIDG